MKWETKISPKVHNPAENPHYDRGCYKTRNLVKESIRKVLHIQQEMHLGLLNKRPQSFCPYASSLPIIVYHAILLGFWWLFNCSICSVLWITAIHLVSPSILMPAMSARVSPPLTYQFSYGPKLKRALQFWLCVSEVPMLFTGISAPLVVFHPGPSLLNLEMPGKAWPFFH